MSKYKMLQTAVHVLRGLGWLVFIGGLAIGFLAWLNPEVIVNYGIPMIGGSNISAGLAIIFVSTIEAVMILALAELINLFMSVDENLEKIKDFFISGK